jgi:hypothetical protein
MSPSADSNLEGGFIREVNAGPILFPPITMLTRPIPSSLLMDIGEKRLGNWFEGVDLVLFKI